MKPTPKLPAEVALAALLDALASSLIQLEITPARVAQIARTSFVKAGAHKARKRSSGRPHLAKIAALTGLTRVEVKRIVAENFSTARVDSESLPRALRVLLGWRTSSLYSNRGKPRRLRVSGRAPSFHSLCKAFSGDIPPRVILDELEQKHRVLLTRDRAYVSIARTKSAVSTNREELEALLFAATFLNDALRAGCRVVRRKERIAASDEISNAYVESAVSGRVTELLDQMPQLFSGNKRRTRNILSVYALVARAEQK